jgi:putative ABC transport system permease protein
MARPDLIATARVAARQMKRHRGSTVLLALLVAAPVALATWSMSILPTLNPTAADQVAGLLGNADFRMAGSGLVVPQNLPAGSMTEMVESSTEPIEVNGKLISVNVRRLQPEATLDRSRSVLVSGRWPNTADELVVSPRMANDLRLREGGSVRIDDKARTVIGIVRSPLSRNGYEVRTVADSLDSKRGYSELLVRLPVGSNVEQVTASITSGFAESRSSYAGASSSDNSITLLAELLPLSEVVLIAAALFTVTATRQRRMLGLMSAVGASARQCALVVLSHAALVGVIGSALGVGAGLVIAEAFRQWLSGRQAFVADSLRVPIGWVVLSAVLATAALLAAAARPAIAAGRESVAASFQQGAKAASKPPASWARVAFGLTLGVAILVLADAAKDAARVVGVVAGLIVLVISAGIASEKVFAHLAAQAAGMRPAVRMALRDLARSRGRTGPLTIALVAALTLSVMMLTVLSSNAAQTRATYQPALEESQVLISAQSQAAADAVALSIGAPRAVPLRAALVPDSAVPGMQRSTRSVESSAAGIHAEVYESSTMTNGGTLLKLGGTVGVVRTEDVDQFTSSKNAVDDLAEGKAVVLSSGLLRADVVMVQPGEINISGVEHVGKVRPRYRAMPAVLISPETAVAHGLTVDSATPFAFVARASSPLSEQQRQAAFAAAQPFRLTRLDFETGYHDKGATVRNVLSLFAVLFSLGLIALIAALTISESAKVSAVLASIGASPRMRRSQAATTTGAVAAIASIAATPVGIVLAAVANEGTPLSPPFGLLGGMLFGLVAVAGLSGALFTRNAPSVVRQRAV